jgi:murein DD-endopeptidase MepM/ murein hydrolase activator NlpD
MGKLHNATKLHRKVLNQAIKKRLQATISPIKAAQADSHANLKIFMTLSYLFFASWFLSVQSIVISSTLKHSLEMSIQEGTKHQNSVIAAEIARILRWRGDIQRDLHRGDRIDALFRYNPYGQKGSELELLFLRYQGQKIVLETSRFSGADGIARYYDEHGRLIEPMLNGAPVPAYVQITDIVQPRRRGQRQHRGIDLKADEGAPVYLPFRGQVRRINWNRRNNGQCIEVTYRSGVVARFLHLASVHPQVKIGKILPPHTLIGTVGSTGHSNGPHLHYEIIRGEHPIEPLQYHGQHAVELPKSLWLPFQQSHNRYIMQFQSKLAEKRAMSPVRVAEPVGP